MYEQQLPSSGDRGSCCWRKVSPYTGENSDIPHQLRDAHLDVTVEKNQRDQEKGRGRYSTAEQPDLSSRGALALL